ncbi:tetratricopeptide repeat protein [Ulvibacterium sp.]|uniref:hybrid sensor histidine kinase/response regulator transcription factor n=1 Tax=Ulvibacterium sp. TaxID=2665914 RepID=UPI003BA9951F
MKQLPLPFVFLFTVLLFSQSRVDSLESKLARTEEDTLKIKILHELYYQLENKSPEEAYRVAKEALSIGENLKKGPLHIESHNVYGDYWYSQSDFDMAIEAYRKAEMLAKEIGSIEGESNALFGLGNAFLRKGNFEKAKECHEKKLVFAEELNDRESIAGSYNSLGLISTEQGNLTEAMEYFIEASKIYREVGHLKYYSITLMSIGMVHRQLGNNDKAKHYYLESDSISILLDDELGRAYVLNNLAIISKNTNRLEEAVRYNKKALELFEKLGNKKKVGEIYYNEGSILLKKNAYRDALPAYQKSLQIALQTNDSVMIAFSNCNLGRTYLLLKDFEKAEMHLLNSSNISEEINLFPIEKDSYELLSEVYEKMGNFNKAYFSRTKYSILKDSLFTKEKRNLANEIEAKYQNEQKTKEIALLESERAFKELQLGKRINERNGIIAFSVVLLLLAGLLYNQYRVKQKTNKELRELDRLKSNFFANISHEFRTPLTLIKGPIEQLEQSPDEGLPIESIKMIRRNNNRVLQLVNQLLDLSKIDEGNLQLEKTEGDVYKCLRGAASSFNSHAAQRNIDYKVQIPHKVLWATFDRDKLEKILYNLLGNAFKFIGDGGLISFSTTYGKGELKMVISDTGMGIAAKKLPYIFDRFYQVHRGDTKDHEGSGIGLSLSKDLVELMDGTITVSSEVGKGTIFTLVIPIQKIRMGFQENIKKPYPGGDEIKTPRTSYTLERPDLRELPSVLLVEDNPDMSYFIKEQLQKNYRVQKAKNGKIGLKLAKSKSPDLIITDVMMPEMDGVELCKSLKADLDTSHIPVIMLTAKAGMENKMVGLQTGADDYLTKPFEPKELLARVENLIEQRKKLRVLFAKKEASFNPKEVTVTSIDETFLQNVLDLLEKEFWNPDFGVPQMQKALALSKAQLHRKLKALTNESPGELLRNFRLKRAAQLLSKKADTVTQIAYAVGFNNLSYFAKCFKELYGVPPSSYR